jgi:preprotein translocase subunit SecA
MAGRGTDILLGGNPEFLAKRKLHEEGVEEDKIELATSFISDIPEDVKAIRERYHQIYSQYKVATDAEKEEVIKAGGLHILGTERHESRRIDNQLRGRSGRQGDEGSSVFFISLEDDLAKRFGGDRMMGIYNAFNIPEDEPLQSKLLSRSIENAQRTIEGKNFGIRKHVIQYDDVMNSQREVMYKERMDVITSPDVHDQILSLIPDYVKETLNMVVDPGKTPESWDMDALNKNIEQRLLPVDTNFVTREKLMNWSYEDFLEKLIAVTEDTYNNKVESYKEAGFNFNELEKLILLRNVDTKWIDHIDAMDQLRKGISLRAYGQVDPVVEYKQEGSEMFDELTYSIQTETIRVLLKAEVKKEPIRREEQPRDLVTNVTEGYKRPAKAKGKVGRNDPCPCGSGKKYKDCCGK